MSTLSHRQMNTSTGFHVASFKEKDEPHLFELSDSTNTREIDIDKELSSVPIPGKLQKVSRPVWMFGNPSTNQELKKETIKQKWSGTIISYDAETIEAILDNLTVIGAPQELVVLYREEIDPREQSLIQKGAQFYWHIGYREAKKSPRERFSKIRFRRLPKWTRSEIEQADMKAQDYADFFSSN